MSPNQYQDMAKTDSDFDNIRSDEQFQALITPGSLIL
ncbi:TPR end-of-group domain-containing protein [Nostoc sp.]